MRHVVDKAVRGFAKLHQPLVFDRQQLVRVPQRSDQAAALDGVVNAAPDRVARKRSFDQVVLGAVLQRLDGDRFIRQAGKHHDRHFGFIAAHGQQRIQAAAVGKREVQQHHVGRVVL